MNEYFSYQQAMKYIKQGLPTIQVGKSKRIAKSDIDKFMAEHRVIATKGK